MRALADDVPGASIGLIEKVLDQYCDPGEKQAFQEATEEQLTTKSDLSIDDASEEPPNDAPPTPEALSGKQIETLWEIHNQPTSTQSEIGDVLGLAQPTINNRLISSPDFSWENRKAFAERFFGTPSREEARKEGGGHSSVVSEDSLLLPKQQFEAMESKEEPPVLTPDLLRKVGHACIQSDAFSEREEVELIRVLCGGNVTIE